jgi:hypothetical protein
VCAVDGHYAGASGQCGEQACAAGCTCSFRYADRWGDEEGYNCACPGAPPAGTCIDVNCGTIRCDQAYSRDQSGQTHESPLVCSDPVRGICGGR